MKSKGPVVHRDRSQKAMMIEAFLRDRLGREVRGLKMLDIGCGNGQISQHFSAENEVFGVDVRDQRHSKEGFEFFQVDDERLPFADAMFDVVISHHVIEHVENQEQHLSELKRVLGANGTGYLACPNGGSPFMVGHVGNDQVPNLQRILTLIKNLGFQFEDYYPRLLKEPKKYHCETMLGQYLPTFALNATRRWHPGHCFLLTH